MTLTTIQSPETQAVALPEQLDTNTLTAKDVIGLAAELIDKNGKCEGQFWSSGDRYCTVGALSQVATGSWASWGNNLVEEAIELIDKNVESVRTDRRTDRRTDSAAAIDRISYGWSDVNTKDTVVQKLREIASS